MLNLILRVYIFILFGFFVARLKKEKTENIITFIINFAIYFLIPFFIFLSVWENASLFFSNSKISILACGIVGFGLFLSLIFSKIFKVEFRNYFLPITFMNSAYLAIPVNILFFGEKGAFFAIIYNVTISILHFTVGVWLVSKRSRVKELLKIPLIYGVIFGFLLNYFGIKIPHLFIKTSFILRNIALPSMLIIVGYQLFRPSSKRSSFLKPIILGVPFRMLGGFLMAVILRKILGISGPAGLVSIMTSSMPAAVGTFIISKKFDANPDFAASMVTVSTILSLITIPLIYRIIT